MEKYYWRDRYFVPYIIMFFIWVAILFIAETINRVNNFFASFEVNLKEDFISFFYIILFLFITIIVFLSFYYILDHYTKNKKHFWESILDLHEKINDFKISNNYIDEKKYQNDLYNFLKTHFPNKNISFDINLDVIHIYYSDDFILEIFWPFRLDWLKKFNSNFNYNSVKWNFLFILEINSKNDNLQESIMIKKNIHNQIVKNTNKKIFFIEKQIV